MPTNTQIKTAIDTDITNKTVPSSATHTNVGARMKSIVDYVDQEITNLADVATSGSYSDLDDTPVIPILPILATVATSGNYTDLINLPIVPLLTQGTIASVSTVSTPYDIIPYNINVILLSTFSPISLPNTNLVVGQEFYIQTINACNIYSNPLNDSSSSIFDSTGGSSTYFVSSAGAFYKFIYLGVLDTYGSSTRWVYKKLNN